MNKRKQSFYIWTDICIAPDILTAEKVRDKIVIKIQSRRFGLKVVVSSDNYPLSTDIAKQVYKTALSFLPDSSVSITVQEKKPSVYPLG